MTPSIHSEVHLLKGLMDSLLPSEEVMWTGKPSAGLRFSPIEWLLGPLTLGWGGWLLILLCSRIDWTDVAQLTGLVSIALIVIYIVAGRFIMDMIRRRRTTYYLTTKRLLRRSGLLGSFVQFININAVTHWDVFRLKHGEATIRVYYSGQSSGLPSPFQSKAYFFELQYLEHYDEFIEKLRKIRM